MTLMVLSVVVTATVGVLFILSLLGKEVSQPDPFSSEAEVAFDALPDLSWMVVHLWPYLLLALAVVVAVTLLFGLFESFRVAGPLFRIRRVLENIASGRFDRPTPPLRRGDALEELYGCVLDLHRDWELRVAEMRRICACEDEEAGVRLAAIRDLLRGMRTREDGA
ncbi:MAG: hypothetical protein D6682_05240 [Zetaproteobacteria bacterium]|nr:MAG: hypothetical protein D6682_05240 [Zetaproteobacteria bacterium]